jgi:hypothetical protein
MSTNRTKLSSWSVRTLKPLGEPVKYYDLQYYDQARARGDGAAFVRGANAISYVPRVDRGGR